MWTICGSSKPPCCSYNIFFMRIEPWFADIIVPRLVDIDEGPINEYDITLEF
jgi:hypothetical protein